MNFLRKEQRLAAAGVIILITLLTYISALHNGFIWDDDAHVTDCQALRTVHGLVRIWTEPGAVQQYYPLVYTTFWVQFHLWQLNPFGYHLVNVLLQAMNAILLWLVLDQLRVRGAWLAAVIFAIHPVEVESVAWITELKNVFSATFYLSALLAYGQFRPWDAEESGGVRRWGLYGLALGLFVCALLSKTVTCTLPAAILLLVWWKRGRIGRRDAWPLVPFFAAGTGLGLVTAWAEKRFIGADGMEWAFTFADRMLIAGRGLWFYAAKVVLPRNLMFVYPHWKIDTGQWWQWMFPLGAVVVAVALYLGRARVGRGPLVAMLFFAGTLGPALGFVNVFPMRYSFVADHFQYLASMGLIAAMAAAVMTILRHPRMRIIGGTAMVVSLSMLTCQRTWVYQNAETLWRDTLAKNPDCWMAHNNLGVLLAARGDVQAARAEYEEALRIKPDFYNPHNNLGNLLRQEGENEKAVAEYRQTLRMEPRYVIARYNMAIALNELGRVKEAMAQYHLAVEMKPDYADAHYNWGIALGKRGQFAEACEQFAQAAYYQPDSAKTQYNWGFALVKQADFKEAIPHFRAALQLNPEFAAAHYSLGVALLQRGRRADGIRELARALELEPTSRMVQSALDAARKGA
ncbi:MAG TPA: tetratricopeptide repeat protein [Verrucomicrobiae bacterium]|nr:tetratricopeptide repeat protein [Verrucomicrobiae bacterium]